MPILSSYRILGAGLAAGALALCTLLVPALAAPDEPAGSPDEDWEAGARTVDLVDVAEGFAFQSMRASESGSDEIRGGYQPSQHRVHYRYQDLGEDGALLTLNLTFLRILEFRDTDESEGYSLGDEIVQRRVFQTIGPIDMDVRSLSSGARAVTIKESWNRTAPVPGEPEAGFVLQFYLLEGPETINGVDIRPAAFRFDVQFIRFPFAANDTLLALETSLESNQALGAAGNRVFAAQGDREAAFSWDERVSTGAEAHPVGVTILDLGDDLAVPGAGDRDTVLFSYPRAEDASLHGASLGVRRFEPAGLPEILQNLVPGDWRVYVVSLAAAGGLLAYGLWRRVHA